MSNWTRAFVPSSCSTRRAPLLPTRWFSHHAIQLNGIASIAAEHLLGELEAHALVYLHIGVRPRAFEVAGPPLSVRLLGHGLEQQPADTPALGLGQYGDNVAEVVSLFVSPELLLRLGLRCFPNVIAAYVEPTTAVDHVHAELLQPQTPRTEVVSPCLRCERTARCQPARYTEHLVRCAARRVFGYVEESVLDPPAAPDA